jgi:hypothetical protein
MVAYLSKRLLVDGVADYLRKGWLVYSGLSKQKVAGGWRITLAKGA